MRRRLNLKNHCSSRIKSCCCNGSNNSTKYFLKFKNNITTMAKYKATRTSYGYNYRNVKITKWLNGNWVAEKLGYFSTLREAKQRIDNVLVFSVEGQEYDISIQTLYLCGEITEISIKNGYSREVKFDRTLSHIEQIRIKNMIAIGIIGYSIDSAGFKKHQTFMICNPYNHIWANFVSPHWADNIMNYSPPSKEKTDEWIMGEFKNFCN